MTTGQLIKAARKKAGITQAELADKLGIPYQSISQWERGTRNPKRENLQRVAVALGVPISDICSDDLMQVFEASNQFRELKEIVMESSDCLSLYATALQQQEAIKVLGGEKIERIVYALDKMNDEGQQKAVERVEELSEIPRYRRPESPPSSPTDTDTPAGEKPAEGA